MSRTYGWFLITAALMSACTAEDGDVSTTTTLPEGAELDVIGLSERPASLLVVDLDDAAARKKLERTLTRIGGALLAAHGERLVIAQVPDGAEAILADAGVVARFDRAVTADDLAGASVAEARFLAVYSNRWHPDARERITALRAADRGEHFEAPAQRAPAGAFARGEGDPGPQPDPEDQVSVPYASGTVVVSVLLPESNGAVDANVENWSEETIREAYLKTQAALDVIAAAEPNADLDFVLHYESAPANGGLEGTVDTDYEFAQRAPWGDWTNEALATADVLAQVLGREVSPDDVWSAAAEYQLSLRRRYHADAAYFLIVGANHNFTGGIRAHAWIGGPWTVLDSGNGMEVYAHEFGHIFGSLDEYCPDACSSPTSLQGYLGIYNANAEFREGDPYTGGINNGRGEAATSLMQYNDINAINGYTRGSWGWLDQDGDGIVDVRDTYPDSVLAAEVTGQTVRLTGQIIDRPLVALWRTGYSANRIVGLELELERDGAVAGVLDVELPGVTRGRQDVDLTLPVLPAGEWTIRARGKNDVGNLEPVAAELTVVTTGTANAAPLAHWDGPDALALSNGAEHGFHASATDLDGDATSVRVDLGGDGSFETGWAETHDLDIAPSPGLWAVVVEARDAAGATASRRFEIPVFEGNAPPELHLANVPSLVHGTIRADLHLDVTAVDPDGGDTELSWVTTLATHDGEFRSATGWGAGNELDLMLPTPERLASRRVDLSAGTPELTRGQVWDAEVIDAHTIAVAGGTAGVWLVDITDPAAPSILGHVYPGTVAKDLFRDGDRLYVLGTMLSVIDISDRRAPREIEQLVATTGKRTATAADAFPIQEQPDYGTFHSLWMEDGEKISGVRITVKVQHPDPGQLLIRLHPPKHLSSDVIVLRDHVDGPGGTRTYTFTDGNTPALRALHGKYSADNWQLEVIDDALDGVTGTLLATELRFTTKSRAAKVLPNATRILGQLPGGELVLAGAGVEVIDTVMPFWLHRWSFVSGTGTFDGALVGESAVVAMPLTSKTGGTATLRGLVAVDLSIPFMPEITRRDTDSGRQAYVVASVGSRIYLHTYPICDDEENPSEICDREQELTWIADADAFTAGDEDWLLGTSRLRVDRRAFGDDSALWTTGAGYVQQLDVSDPAALAVIREYPQSWTQSMLPLEGSSVLLFQMWHEAQIADLDSVVSTLSRTYRIAVEARDGAGAIRRAYRTVQVIPYDHAPAFVSIEHTAGFLAGEWATFRIVATDPDQGTLWDPSLLVRADWNGDGVWDSDWAYLSNLPDQWFEMQNVYAAPGTYRAVFEVRDGFWASSRQTLDVTIQ